MLGAGIDFTTNVCVALIWDGPGKVGCDSVDYIQICLGTF